MKLNVNPNRMELLRLKRRLALAERMNAEGIYFASGVHLVRWEWPD